MKYEKTLTIPNRFYHKYQQFIGITGKQAYDLYGLKGDESISESVFFDNGIEVEVKIVIPIDEDSYTWTEAIIYDNNQYVGCTEPSEDFFGEWYLEDNKGNQYTLNIVRGEEPVTDFMEDVDKMYDLLGMSRKEFLEKYLYVSEQEYDLTINNLYDNLVGNLADMFRTSENMLIEENTYFDNEETNPYKDYKVTGEQFKSRVYDFMAKNLTKEEQEEVTEIAIGMGC